MDAVEEKRIVTRILGLETVTRMLYMHGDYGAEGEIGTRQAYRILKSTLEAYIVIPSEELIGPVSVQVIATNDGYLARRFIKMPNGNTLADFEPKDYL